STNCAMAADLTPMTTPGPVQNWPQPMVTELARPSASSLPRSSNACGSMNIGFTLDISANSGIGSSRAAAKSNKARPQACEPVKPTALMADSTTNWAPTLSPKIILNVPAGMPVLDTARSMAPPTLSEVTMCPGCALTTTGQPAANAEAVSPPATENANGKFDAPNTATGPIACCICRTSGAASLAVSIRAPR